MNPATFQMAIRRALRPRCGDENTSLYQPSEVARFDLPERCGKADATELRPPKPSIKHQPNALIRLRPGCALTSERYARPGT